MKKKLLILSFLAIAYAGNAQIKFSDLLLYNGNMNGAYSVGYVGNQNRKFDMGSFIRFGDSIRYVTYWQFRKSLDSMAAAAPNLSAYLLKSKHTTDSAYLKGLIDASTAKRVASVGVAGGSTKTLTITFADATTVQTTYTDLQGSGSGGVDNDADSLGGLPASSYATNAALTAHASNTSNPHSVTKAQVSLGNVPNVDATNPANITQSSTYRFTTDAEKTTWNAKMDSTRVKALIAADSIVFSSTDFSGLGTTASPLTIKNLPTGGGVEYNVKNYGASRGLSDNGSAISAAISAANAAGGGTVLIPEPGIWYIKTAYRDTATVITYKGIRLKSNVWLKGVPGAIIKRWGASPAGATFTFNSVTSYTTNTVWNDMVYGDSVFNCTVSDLIIDGNLDSALNTTLDPYTNPQTWGESNQAIYHGQVSQAGTQTSCIAFRKGSRNTVARCSLINAPSYGVNYRNSTYGRVDRVYTTNCVNGGIVFSGSSDFTEAWHSVSTAHKGDGIRLQSSNVGAYYCEASWAPQNTGPNGSGQSYGGIYATGSHNRIIGNNVHHNFAYNIDTSPDGKAGVTDCVISGNTVDSGGNAGILVGIDYSVVTNNDVFDNAYTGTASDPTMLRPVGIALAGSIGNIVNYNRIKGSAYQTHGIQLDVSSNNQIIGNYVQNATAVFYGSAPSTTTNEIALNTLRNASGTFTPGGVPGSTPASDIVLDNFSGTSGASIAGRSPSPTNTTATTWTLGSGTVATINASNAVSFNHSNNTVIQMATLETGTASQTIQATINQGSQPHDLGIIARYTDANNHWAAIMESSGNFTLYERVAGSYTMRDRKAVTYPASTDMVIKIVCTGNVITATVNSGNTLTYTSTANNTATKAGLLSIAGNTAGTTAYTDDFKAQ